MKALVPIGTLVLMLAGCGTDSLYFGTYTRVGIDASSDGAGIGAKNVALNIAPPKKDGTAFDVLGTSDLDMSYTDVVIQEVVAVGDAAKCAAMKNKASGGNVAIQSQDAQSPAVGPIIFGTYSSWSFLDLSWGGATATGINFGYKRGVGVRIPIVNNTVGAVYASVSVNTTDGETVAPKTNIEGIRSRYTFATGSAAVIKAAQEAKSLNGGDQSYAGCLN
ncbi:hypothetical protein SAMN03159304_04562 [Pseudomonas sp. NFACC24-1]|uniref:hypothetical protein n=1 Tax=Pseudomonas sp. NFACC24-1 TaxID=1566189 RepID=UPI0008E4BF00|nr:hypothetical protein [Pseudomonas sp. NFACC24-1]SFO67456.1 hypothetical protein SAMN03159304_04562 [Pseudomonas sp. NFACC24-1]